MRRERSANEKAAPVGAAFACSLRWVLASRRLAFDGAEGGGLGGNDDPLLQPRVAALGVGGWLGAGIGTLGPRLAGVVQERGHRLQGGLVLIGRDVAAEQLNLARQFGDP